MLGFAYFYILYQPLLPATHAKTERHNYLPKRRKGH